MSDWLIGLSQGLTNGILFKQRQEEDQFRKTQDILVEQIHRDAANIRPEDRMKLLEPVHAITTAKNQKQLDAAWGRYAAMGVAENYEQERADREYNANLPTEPAIGVSNSSGPQDTSLPAMGLQPAMVEANPYLTSFTGNQPRPDPSGKRVPVQISGGEPIKVMGGEGLAASASEDARLLPRDPNAYAQGKVRYATDEGKAGRQIEVLERRGEIQTAGSIRKQELIGRQKLAEIKAKAESQGLKNVKLVQNDDGTAALAGIDAKGNPVVHSLEGYNIPQNVLGEMRLQQQKTLAEDALKERKREFDLKLDLSKKEFALKSTESQARVKEITEKISRGHWGKTGSNTYQAANVVLRKADSDMRVVNNRMAALHREADSIRDNMKNNFDMSSDDKARALRRLDGIGVELASLGLELDQIQESRDAKLDALDDAVSDAARAAGTREARETKATGSGGGGGSRPSPNKQPSLKVGSIRQQLGLGK